MGKKQPPMGEIVVIQEIVFRQELGANLEGLLDRPDGPPAPHPKREEIEQELREVFAREFGSAPHLVTPTLKRRLESLTEEVLKRHLPRIAVEIESVHPCGRVNLMVYRPGSRGVELFESVARRKEARDRVAGFMGDSRLTGLSTEKLEELGVFLESFLEGGGS